MVDVTQRSLLTMWREYASVRGEDLRRSEEGGLVREMDKPEVGEASGDW